MKICFSLLTSVVSKGWLNYIVTPWNWPSIFSSEVFCWLFQKILLMEIQKEKKKSL